jgi:hypothetical protein
MAWVLVECVSSFKIKYMVEVKDGNPVEWALDTVTMGDAKEFSQKHLDETIFSYRVVTEEEALKLCNQDNDYFAGWSDDKKKEAFFTSIEEQR